MRIPTDIGRCDPTPLIFLRTGTAQDVWGQPADALAAELLAATGRSRVSCSGSAAGEADDPGAPIGIHVRQLWHSDDEASAF